MGANDRQVGGSHYSSKIIHWDWVEAQGMGYLEGYATKYLVRWRNKDGIKDLEKSLHIIEKLIEVAENTPRRNRATNINMALTREFFAVNNVPEKESKICWLLLTWVDTDELRLAHQFTEQLIADQSAIIRVGDTNDRT